MVQKNLNAGILLPYHYGISGSHGSGGLFCIDEHARLDGLHFEGGDDGCNWRRCGCTEEWLSLACVDGLGTRRQTSLCSEPMIA